MSLFLVGVYTTKEKRNIQFITNLFGHYTLGVVVVALARITGRKAIVRVASSVTEILARPGLTYTVFYPIMKRLEEFALDHADAIVNISPMPLMEKYAEKTFELPFLLEYSASSAITKAADVILFVGRLEPEKGLSTLLEAAKIFTKKTS